MPVSVLFKNIKLIDGVHEPMEAAAVTVADGQIQDVVLQGPLPSAEQTIDGRGCTLLPGLIDAHVHLGAIDVNVLEQHRNYASSLAAIKVSRIIQRTLREGFTTVRDAGGIDAGFRSAVEEGLIEGPRILVAGRPLSQTGGHGDFRRPSEVGDPVSCCSDIGYVMQLCDGVDEVMKCAREQLRRGADHIKVLASGGAMSPNDGIEDIQYSVAEIRAAVEVARAAGTYVMAHAISAQAIRNCVEAGARSIEHGNLLDDETAKLMAQEGTYLVSTLAVYQNLCEQGASYGVSSKSLAKCRFARDQGLRALECAQRSGVKIASGSDLLGDASVFKARELQLKAGVIGAHAAIIASTRTNAELLGLDDQLGTVEPGKQADLLLVEGDPIADISLLQDPSRLKVIMKQGKVVQLGDRAGVGLDTPGQPVLTSA